MGPVPEVPSCPVAEEAEPPHPAGGRPSLDTPTNERTEIPRRIARASRRPPWSPKQREAWYRAMRDKLAAALERAGCSDDATRVGTCGDYRVFVDPCGHTRYGREQCEHRLCPRCARRRARRQVRAWEDAAKRVPKRRGYRWRMVTLTLRVGSTQGRLFGLSPATLDLKADVVRIKDCFAKLRRSWRGQGDGLAGFYTVEVGDRVTGRNVHLHVLVYSPWVDQAELAEQWEQLTGDSRVVDVRAVRGGIHGAMKEVAKYITKLNLHRDVDELVAIHLAMKGKATGRAFGLCHGMVDEPPAADSPACPICGSTTWYWVADPAIHADVAARAPPSEHLESVITPAAPT